MSAPVEADARRLLSIPRLQSERGLVHGFSTLALGSMRDEASRRRLSAALGLEWEEVTVAGAVHGAEIATVQGAVPRMDDVDGLVTAVPGRGLFVSLGDCYPLIAYDRRRRALGLAHAGWRGTAAGIAGELVARLTAEYGCDPADLLVGIGPGICGRCYEVGDDVARRFPANAVRPGTGDGKFLLDLVAANRAALVEAGVRPENVHAAGICTYETAALPSHRRDGDGRRFACLAALRR